jgi:membrane protease YdiL (CAAX protease family)
VLDSREPPSEPPFESHDEPPASEPPLLVARIVAAFEVLLASGYPTQVALGGTFKALGYGPFTATGDLATSYVVGVSLVDALLVVGLVLLFLISHGERPRDVIVGRRSIVPEILAGVPLILVALGIAFGVLIVVQFAAPSLHTVETNPLQALLKSPRDAWLFAAVVVFAGGVREEVQRAFILHRFDVWLGGGPIGLVITSIAFGAGHLLQGFDAAIATGLLGAFWGVVYLRRRSAIAPMVSHTGFDLVQIVQFLLVRR